MSKILFHHARVVTMDDRQPTAQAVLVEDGKIARVGADEELLALRDAETELRDLGGKALLPGFIDPHSHMNAVAYSLLMVNANPSPSGRCDTREALLEELRKGLAEGDFSQGEWLMAMGYDPSVFPDKRHVNRLELDTVSTEVPICCIHASGHMCVMNTKGLQLMGYWGEFTVPEGGAVERFPDGTPNGQVAELAYLSPQAQAKVKVPGPERVIASLRKACDLYASYGVTTAQDAKVGVGTTKLLRAGGASGALTIDVVCQVSPESADALLVKGQTVGPYTDHIRMGGYKIFLDGSPQAKTAWLSKPYHVPPEGHDADYCGFPQIRDEEVVNAAKLCLENGWQLNVHCNGDAASEQLVRCYAKAIEETGIHRDLRPVMIHAQTVREDQLDRMKEMGMIVSFFLDHIYYWGDWHYESVLGPERAERISPARSAVRRGISFTMHQDSPVVPPNVMLAVHNAVNRKTSGGRVLGADQCLTVDEALRGVTINGAYQIFEEDRKGSITPGKVADLVILGADPHDVPAAQLRDIPVLETIKDGKTIYRA